MTLDIHAGGCFSPILLVDGAATCLVPYMASIAVSVCKIFLLDNNRTASRVSCDQNCPCCRARTRCSSSQRTESKTYRDWPGPRTDSNFKILWLLHAKLAHSVGNLESLCTYVIGFANLARQTYSRFYIAFCF